MIEHDALLILNAIKGVGSATIRRIIDRYGSAVQALSLTESDLVGDGIVTSKIASNIFSFPRDKFLKSEYNLISKKNVKLITYLDDFYPSTLKNIVGAPYVLYTIGKIPESKISLGFVGSRRASIYGMNISEKFAHRFADLGITIVSGMARGIDTAAHKGALKAKGKTVAALGCGLMTVYPPENRKLFQDIASNGAVVSEFPMEMQPLPQNFPRRNRIISGLSLATVVVEAAQRSGALITADFALEQGKEVYAIPGKVDSPTSKGVNNLIKQGAKLVTCIEDILEDLGPQISECLKFDEREKISVLPDDQIKESLSDDAKELLEFIGSKKINIDEMVDKIEIDVKKLAVLLFQLEVKKLIKQYPGKYYKRI